MVLARETERQLKEFNAQDLANTAWAFATLSRPDEMLFMPLALEAERRLNELNTQELANMAWAFATVNQPHAKLLVALDLEVERRVREFNAQVLSQPQRWALSHRNLDLRKDLIEGSTIELNPAKLTHQIKEAATIDMLFWTHRAFKVHLDHTHLSACWTCLGRLARQRPAK